ncbi:MAG: hypothetical protein WBA10_19585 [Elainellaceae cyanobacterium]
MAHNPMVGTRVPVEWRDEIEKLANRTGRRPAQIVHEAIALYLDKGSADTLTGQVERLSAKVEQMEKQLQALRILVAG